VIREWNIKLGTLSKLILLGWLVFASTCSWALDLDAVLKNVAVLPPASVDFREIRHNPLFDEPLILTGHLEYIEAGQLRKVVETPFKEAFLINSDHIEVERNGKIEKLSLKKNKFLKVMLGGIEAILAGQPENLASIFSYKLTGTSSCWSLKLEPLSRSASRHLASLLVTGDEKSVNSIRFDLKDGEWHLMEIIPVDPEP
jgi:hypothetical protein